MAITPIKYAMGLAITSAIAMFAGGCVSGLFPPSLDEQAQLLHATRFSPTTRFAIASRNSNLHTVPTHPIGEQVSRRVADVVAEKLLIQAVPLPHESGSDWSEELGRAYDATGWITASDNENFFRDLGFDGYVLITLDEDIEHYDGPKGQVNDRTFATYDPVYHMFSLPLNKKKVLLMQAGRIGRFTCELDGERFKNEPACVDTFVKRFRRELIKRLDGTKIS